MFLNDIKKGVSDFITWKSIRLKGVLTVTVPNDLISVPLPNLILASPAYKVSMYSWSGYFLIRAKY